MFASLNYACPVLNKRNSTIRRNLLRLCSSFSKRGDLSPINSSVGTFLETNRIFSDKDVSTFATLTGDHNPLHLNPGFAASTIFKRTVVHGSLVASLFPFLVSFDGAIYLRQTLDFKAPVFVGHLVIARVEVVSSKVRSIGTVVTCATTCHSDGRLVVEGTAVVVFPLSSP